MKHHADAARKFTTDPAAREKPARGREPPKLTDEQREFIVRRLAAYERPSRIRREVRERFGIENSHAGIDLYEESRTQMRSLSSHAS